MSRTQHVYFLLAEKARSSSHSTIYLRLGSARGTTHGFRARNWLVRYWHIKPDITITYPCFLVSYQSHRLEIGHFSLAYFS